MKPCKLLGLILMGGLVLVAGCMTDSVVLVHPQTQMAAQCGPYYFTGASSGLFSKAAAMERERDCISDYQRQGYERR
jgi:hypothetical protein